MTPADSWWGLLMSGAVGSIVGGLATLGGVLLVIRHERRSHRQERLTDAMHRLLAASVAKEARQPGDALRSFGVEVALAMGLASDHDPELAEALKTLTLGALTAEGDEEMRAHEMAVGLLAAAWVAGETGTAQEALEDARWVVRQERGTEEGAAQ